MHYYQHHIGDFIRDTSRLSDSQCMAYMRLLWMYYESEKPITLKPALLAMKIGADIETVELILEAFFKRDGAAWRHSRCDREIAEYHDICERNRANGKQGGRPKKPSGFPVGSESVASGMPAGTQAEPSGNPAVTLTINHNPVTSNHKPKEEKKEPPPPSESPLDFIWSVGTQLLGDKSRSIIGKARKEMGDEKVTQVLAQMAASKPPISEPIAYFVAATKPKVRGVVI